MALFLQIIGALVVLFFLLLIVGFFWIRYKLRSALGDLTGNLVAGVGTAFPPMQISLRRLNEVVWDDATQAEQLSQALQERGFTNAGHFQVEELPVRLQAWILPGDAMYAVIYEHAQAGVYADVITEYAPHGALTVSSAPTGHELEHRPEYDKIYLRDAEIEELYALMLRERRAGDYRTVSAGEFVERFEQFYADEMQWRCTQGGATEAEIRRIAQEGNISIDDESVAQQVEWNQRQASENLTETVYKNWLQNSTLGAAQGENVRDRVLIIHENMPVFLIEEVILELAETDDEDDTTLNLNVPLNCQARERFRLLNERLPSSQCAEKIDAISQPIAADIYVRPNDNNND